MPQTKIIHSTDLASLGDLPAVLDYLKTMGIDPATVTMVNPSNVGCLGEPVSGIDIHETAYDDGSVSYHAVIC